ncbi:sterol-binding protein [Streptacidiphilus sp. N1-12]|uniref:Sterol-binding protein n=2 Tax=Streptacidiphilus alkalitolerans TaxID=3342712 RepID=A0ABV6V3V9_9ACTN
MANPAECRAALEQLSRNLGKAEGNVRTAASLDRSLTCWITDLDITFSGRLQGGTITGLTESPGRPAEKAQIGLSMTGDDLVALVNGKLNFASAWATGRVKLDAGIRDLLQLRKLL